MKPNSWFNMQVLDDSSTQIDVFDEIGFFGISAKDFKAELEEKDRGGTIKVSINSPGGDVFDGIAIYSLLAERRERVHVEVYGLAASIASVIALSGSSLTMRAGTFFMIHDPWSLVMGNSDEMRKTAGILDKIADQIYSIYSGRTALTDEELRTAMKSETWYTAQEALDVGFASSIEGEKVAASANFAMLEKFSNRPVGLDRKQAPSLEETVKESTMENNVAKEAQAAESVQDKTDERFAALETQFGSKLDSKIEEVKNAMEEKLASISVRPNVKPNLKDEGAQWFYDALREATSEKRPMKAAAGVVTTSDGMGIPVAASEQIMMNVNQMSWLRKYGADVRPAGAQQTRFSTVVDSGAAGIISEGGNYTDKADPTLITLALYKLGGRFSLTEETDEDTFMNMFGVFQQYAARLIARSENEFFIKGSGSSQPKGIVGEDASVTAAAVGAVTFDELLELDEAIDPEWNWTLGDIDTGNYTGPVYFCSSKTAIALRKLQDTNNNFFFRQHENGFHSLFGRPLVRTPHIEDMAATEKAIILAHPAAYLIGERRPNLALKVGYDNDTHNVTWDFNERVGGEVWDSNGVAVLAMAAT